MGTMDVSGLKRSRPEGSMTVVDGIISRESAEQVVRPMFSIHEDYVEEGVFTAVWVANDRQLERLKNSSIAYRGIEWDPTITF